METTGAKESIKERRQGHALMFKKRIKYAMETFAEKLIPWAEDEIDKEIRSWILLGSSKNIIWCYDSEELFDNPHINRSFKQTTKPNGYIQIKYASEQTTSVPTEWGAERIESFLLQLAIRSNRRSFIWCDECEELFKEN